MARRRFLPCFFFSWIMFPRLFWFVNIVLFLFSGLLPAFFIYVPENADSPNWVTFISFESCALFANGGDLLRRSSSIRQL